MCRRDSLGLGRRILARYRSQTVKYCRLQERPFEAEDHVTVEAKRCARILDLRPSIFCSLVSQYIRYGEVQFGFMQTSSHDRTENRDDSVPMAQ